MMLGVTTLGEPTHHGAKSEPAGPLVRKLTVADPSGFHCKPAAQMAKIALKFDGAIEVERRGVRADAKSVMALLALLAVPEKNVTFDIIVDGPGAEAVVADIEKALNGEFDGGKHAAGGKSGALKAVGRWGSRLNLPWSKGRADGNSS